jgi:hypothetical protein
MRRTAQQARDALKWVVRVRWYPSETALQEPHVCTTWPPVPRERARLPADSRALLAGPLYGPVPLTGPSPITILGVLMHRACRLEALVA